MEKQGFQNGKILNRLPNEMAELINKIGDLGDLLRVRVFVVGGFVRDLILGQTSPDIDISVEGNGIEFAQEFYKRFGNKIKIHEKFQTAAIRCGNFKIDIVTARSEYYEHFGALPTVQKADIKSDLLRRDFSINSIAILINKKSFGQILDPVGGQKDLQAGIIRVLYNMSFMDDPTRIFRAVKFEQRYKFGIAQETLNLINEAVKSNVFNFISKERIANELNLIFNEDSKMSILKRLVQLDVFRNLIENLRIDENSMIKWNDIYMNNNN